MKNNHEIAYWCSTRDVLQTLKLMAAGFEKGDAIRYAIGNKMTEDDMSQVTQNIGSSFFAPSGGGNIADELTKYKEMKLESADLSKRIRERKEKLAAMDKEISDMAELQAAASEKIEAINAKIEHAKEQISNLATLAKDKRKEIAKAYLSETL